VCVAAEQEHSQPLKQQHVLSWVQVASPETAGWCPSPASYLCNGADTPGHTAPFMWSPG
jgi:hypothetical protein